MKISLAAFALAALAVPAVSAQTTCSASLDRPAYLPGDCIFLTITGNPGDLVFLFFGPNMDPVTTSTTTPLILGNIDPTGSLVVGCEAGCKMPEAYLQAVTVDLASFDPTTLAGVCVTNDVFLSMAPDETCGVGTEGCTPGYWKQTQHFVNWPAPYQPTDLFDSVFEDAFPGMTLLDVLSQGGGGLNALGRHAVAALLGAASGAVDSGPTVDDVVGLFDFSLGQSAAEQDDLKDVFEYFNELGCPL